MWGGGVFLLILALPSERSARIALRTQQVLAHESGVADTVDPFAGSYFIESLTDEIETRSWELMKKVEAIINSMTKKERANPDIINGSRKKRIAAGSGTTVRDVNQLIKQFYYARDLLKRMGKGSLPRKMPFMP